MIKLFENYIRDGLERVYQKTAKSPECIFTLEPGNKYAIFSDLHKGYRDKSDKFQQCEAAYLKALNYYFENGYHLIILGDAEELLKQVRIKKVLDAYQEVMQKEADFHREQRYFKIWGNHDRKWKKESRVRKYLHPTFPNLKVYEGIILRTGDHESSLKGDIFLSHGHQGTFFSDRYRFFGEATLVFYRIIQNLFPRLGLTFPSKNSALRARHDTAMYLWAARKKNLILITGHTHRPVWCSTTHVQKMATELHGEIKHIRALTNRLEQTRTAKVNLREIEQIKGDLKGRSERAKVLKQKLQEKKNEIDARDTIKTLPVYFNTGCCIFSDGDITGIEMEDDQIRLVRWFSKPDRNDESLSEILESDNISSFFTDFDINSLLHNEIPSLQEH